ncbi:unnamed protein product (macronuclear) [Paramecium tetraurelia]|uniref:CCD97-like C-terminal domain-containing protein n=1 Tax=Paramecium tetraurelia TaxID=5888 RepID=A0DB76_PARTE|nr:uncharacterized protein GSPATT00015187001 [Paramecium tetraurelia]CAK80293.1 unnamed protein product [Paramecium tetraurelia]|eukprot:XP_001447690.1 hypothetical protein (macronuclear) [Paramecium tetraurelia strain d4-2]
MFKWFNKDKPQPPTKLNKPYPQLSREQAQEILANFSYRTMADLIYKDDSHPDLNVEYEQKKQIQLKTECHMDEQGNLYFNQEEQLSWVDEDSHYEEDELDKQIYEQMYEEMQEELQQRGQREHFRPITGPENNDNDEWETDSDEQN